MFEGAELIRSGVTWDHEWPVEACRFSFSANLFRRCCLVFFGHVSHLGRRAPMVTTQLVCVTACFPCEACDVSVPQITAIGFRIQRVFSSQPSNLWDDHDR